MFTQYTFKKWFLKGKYLIDFYGIDYSSRGTLKESTSVPMKITNFKNNNHFY